MRSEPLFLTFVAALGAATVAVATLGAASSARAAANDTAPAGEATISQRVPLGDLNLSTEDGARAAIYRIRAAANFVCGSDGDDDIRNLYRREQHQACITATTDRTVRKLATPVVTAVYFGSQGAIRLSAR